MNSSTRRAFAARLGATMATLSSSVFVLAGCGGGGTTDGSGTGADTGGGSGGGSGGGGVDVPLVAQFNYGVASGDPLTDRVVLWTHARYADRDDDVPLTCEVASDTAFANLVAAGPVTATAAAGHTVKVDATGLAAGRSYFYRFRQGTQASPVGRTRTLPAAGASRVQFAVVSCSNYPAGYFNVCAEVARSGAEYLLHLGDVIYESAAGSYGSTEAAALGRAPEPPNECLSQADYRRRHAQARSDADAQAMYAALPLLAIWDDHDSAGNAHREGAASHSPESEGLWALRVINAVQAWFEWMPIRPPDRSDLRRIQRSFDFGGLVKLHLLETRLTGRDAPLQTQDLLNPATSFVANAALGAPSRTMLGAEQRDGLLGQLAASTATWQLLGQPVLMGRMRFPASVLRALDPAGGGPTDLLAAQQAVSDYLGAKSAAASNPAGLTPAQQALLDPVQNPLIGYNLDAWDGYPAERETLLGRARQLGKRLVVVAGDTHNAWASKLTLADGSVVGQEFATPSISSSGLAERLPAIPAAQMAQVFRSIVDDLQYAETARCGHLNLLFTPTEARATWTFVSTVKSRSYTVETSAPIGFAGTLASAAG
jgi:alkaline phosphatase D